MGSSRSGVASLALLISLIFIIFDSGMSAPHKEHNIEHQFNRNSSHNRSEPYSSKYTAIHVSKSTAVAIYESKNRTVIHPLNRNEYCPRDAMKMHICFDLMQEILNITAGKPADHPCCSALFGLIDLEAAMCLCTTIKATILGFTVDLPIKMTLLLNFCNKPVPKGFICK